MADFRPAKSKGKLLTPKQLLRAARDAQDDIDAERMVQATLEQAELEKSRESLMLEAALATPRGRMATGLAEEWTAHETHASRQAGRGPIVLELKNADEAMRERWEADGNITLIVAVLGAEAASIRAMSKQLKTLEAEITEIGDRQCTGATVPTDAVVRSAFTRNPAAFAQLRELVEATVLAECERRQSKP